MKALVTGGAGFLGSNLCRTLLNKNFEVHSIDNLITGTEGNLLEFRRNKNFYFHECNIVDSRNFKRITGAIHFTHIFNLACPTGVPNIKRFGEEMLLTCSAGVVNVLELARLQKAKFLLTSSAEMYGQPEVTPQGETYNGSVDPIGPRSAYEEAKRFAEALAKMYVDKYGVDGKIVRIFNTYGPGMSLNDERVIPHFLKCLKGREPLRVYGDGSQTRTHLYVDDLVSGLLLVAERGVAGEAYNLGGEQQVTIKELASTILKLSDCDYGIRYVPHFIEDHHHRQPLVEKAKALGWSSKVSLEDGLIKMFSYYGIEIPAFASQKEMATGLSV